MSEDATPLWKQRERELKRRAGRVFLPAEIPGHAGVVALPSGAAYVVNVCGQQRRINPKSRASKKQRRAESRERLRAAREAVASLLHAKSREPSCSPA